MELNWYIIGIIAAIVIVIIVFTIRRNQKEKKKLEQKLNNEYFKDEDLESDANDIDPLR